jgi:predicted transcriptional regulator
VKLIPETIGDRVLVWVKENHGTQTNAAHALGISQGLLSAVIKGYRKPPSRILEAMGLVERRVEYVEKAAQ